MTSLFVLCFGMDIVAIKDASSSSCGNIAVSYLFFLFSLVMGFSVVYNSKLME